MRTVQGYGYAFAAEAVEEGERTDPRTRCFLDSGERLTPLRPGENLLGRDELSVVPLESAKVSRRHCRIVVSTRGAVLEDLGSRNGTYLWGERIAGPQWLADGDEILIWPVKMTFHSARMADLATEPGP